MTIRVERYKRRYWAVWNGSRLVAVMLYRKGAENVARLLREAKGGDS